LGPKDSKVRSLKMDASIWSNELIEVRPVLSIGHGEHRLQEMGSGLQLHFKKFSDELLTMV